MRCINRHIVSILLYSYPMPCATAPSPLLSASLLARLRAAGGLDKCLAPEGMEHSPYRVLSYHSVISFDSPAGQYALVRRTQRVRFLQHDVRAVLDHVWGDGVPIAHYDHNSGQLEDTFVDRGIRHLVIGLLRRAQRGDVRTFQVEQLAIAGFAAADEWLETKIDHPTDVLSREVRFPIERPCRWAELHAGPVRMIIPVRRGRDGRTRIRFRVYRPVENLSYCLHWRW